MRKISILLSIVATLALIFCFDTMFWHILPLGFEGTLAYGSRAYWLGLSFSVFAVACAFFNFVRQDEKTFGIGFCAWSVGLVLAFGFLFFMQK